MYIGLPNLRPPDIAYRKNVRFGTRLGDWGNGGGGAALDRRTGEGKPETGCLTHCEPHPQARAREDGCRLVEHLTESLCGARSMRRAERSEGDTQLAIADANVARSGEQFMQQGSSFLIDPGIVRPQKREQIAFSLIEPPRSSP